MEPSDRQTISLDELTTGMYVVDLDIPWMNSPFLTHARRIKGAKDIEALKKSGVKSLVIDTKKGPAKAPESSPSPDAPSINSSKPDTQPSEIPDSPVEESSAPDESGAEQAGAASVSLSQEMAAAKQVRNQVKRIASQMLSALQEESPLDATLVNPLVDDTLASLERNNQALMTLVHLSRKSQKLADHSFSTYCLALNIALQMGLSTQETQALGLAALLHDSGWSKLPLNLMGKRKAYSASEVTLVQTHVMIGCKMLRASQVPPDVIRMVEEHHELANGSGYPKGLTAQELHPLTPILSLADSYDERVHNLIDRPGVLPRNAVRELYMEAEGGLYNKKATQTLISLLGVYPVTSAVLLNTGEKGVVAEISHHSVQPKITLYYDAKGKPYPEPFMVDLSLDNERTMTKALDCHDSRDDPYGLLATQ